MPLGARNAIIIKMDEMECLVAVTHSVIISVGDADFGDDDDDDDDDNPDLGDASLGSVDLRVGDHGNHDLVDKGRTLNFCG